MKIKYDRFQPCEHRGCLSHISHPCEGCGRIGGDGIIYHQEPSPTIVQQPLSGSPEGSPKCLYGYTDCNGLGINCDGCKPMCYDNHIDI